MTIAESTAPEPSFILPLAIVLAAFAAFRVRRKPQAALFLLGIALSPTVYGQAPQFSIGAPSLQLVSGQLAVSAPIENHGSGTAANVRVTAARLGSVAAVFTPGSPILLGDIPPAASAPAPLSFPAASLIPGATVLLTLTGTYTTGGNQLLGFTGNRFVTVPTAGGGGGLTPQQRTESMNAANAKFRAVIGPNLGDGNAELLAFLKTRPEFKAAGISVDQCVWAQWTDGVLLTFLNNEPPPGAVLPAASLDGGAPTAASPRPLAAGAPVPRPVKSAQLAAAGDPPTYTSLPQSDNARLIYSLSDKSSDPTPEIYEWLHSSGYVLLPPQEGTLEQLATIGGEGVLFWMTHGGACSGSLYCLFSTTKRTETLDLSYKPDLLDNNIAECFVQEDSDPHYCITTNYIQAHWGRFSQNSFVFLNSCGTLRQLTTDPNSPEVQAALQLIATLFGQGASVVAGWTGFTDFGTSIQSAPRAARFVFDRLLGMNALSGNLAETPNQRPFPWIQVQLDMPKHRVGHSPLGGDLLFFVNRDQAGDGFGLLAPSIEKITVEESEQDVLVSGFFGTAADPSGRSQELRMGGSTLHVTEWFPGRIRATLPKDVAGLTNLTLGAHKSNDAMVTAWDQLTLDYKFFWSTLMEQTLFKVNLRADIRAYREQIHEDPIQPTPDLAPAPGSTVKFHAEGTETCTDAGGTVGTYEVITSDYPLDPVDYNHQPITMSLGGSFQNSSSGHLGIAESQSDKANYQIHEHFVYPTKPPYIVDVTLTEGYRPIDDEVSNSIPLLLDAGAKIQAGLHSATPFKGGNVCSGAPTVKESLQWGPASPRAGTAPRSDSAR